MSENNLHNLLSRHDRRTLSVAYYTRVAGVACFLVGGVAVAGLIMLFPAYLSLSHEISVTRGGIESFAEDDQTFRDDVKRIKEFQSLSEHVRMYLGRERGTEYLDHVLAADTKAIVVDTYVFDRAARRMMVSGTADTRSDLVSFSDALETNNAFESVKVPVENFAKSVELPFVITLTLATSSKSDL